MSSEQDEAWLYGRLPHPTDNEIESFCERVAIQTAQGISEVTARSEAVLDLIDKRHKRNEG